MHMSANELMRKLVHPERGVNVRQRAVASLLHDGGVRAELVLAEPDAQLRLHGSEVVSRTLHE